MSAALGTGAPAAAAAASGAHHRCHVAPSGLPKPQASAKNPCLRILDVTLSGHRLSLTIRTRPGADGRVWATVRQPGVTKYLALTGSGAVHHAHGRVPRGRWTIAVHFKPDDNRLWRPVIARRRLVVPQSPSTTR